MKRCPQCGAPCSRPGQKFCGNCGAPLSETPPQPSVSWPPAGYIHRKRMKTLVGMLVVVVALLVAAGIALSLRPKTPPAAPATAETATTEAALPTAGPDLAATAEPTAAPAGDWLYLENLVPAEGLVLTADGVAIDYGVAPDGRLYIEHSLLTTTDVLLRAIRPAGEGYETSLALVSKPSNPTASFGAMTPCEADGYNQPDEEYLDAMLTVFYKSLLTAFNSRQVADLRFSTDLNDQSWTQAITMGAYDAVAYDRDSSDMTFTTNGLGYGDGKVTLNAAGQWVGTNRNTGAQESGTDYMTIQAVWRDGVWQVDRCVPCTEVEFNAGTLMISSQ